MAIAIIFQSASPSTVWIGRGKERERREEEDGGRERGKKEGRGQGREKGRREEREWKEEEGREGRKTLIKRKTLKEIIKLCEISI